MNVCLKDCLLSDGFFVVPKKSAQRALLVDV